MKRVAYPCFFLFLLLALVPSRAEAQVAISNEWPKAEPPAPSPGYTPGDAFNQLDVAATVRGIYNQFADLTRRSGQEIRFELSEVKTYRAAQFGQVSLVEMMNPLRGEALQTYEVNSMEQLPSNLLFSYRTAWTPGNTEGGQAQIDALSRYSVADAVPMKEAHEPGSLKGLVAVSTFDVAVEFESKSVEYSAAVWWREYSAARVVFSLVDNVTTGVAQFYVEGLDSERKVVPFDQLNEPAPPAEPLLPASCVAESSTVRDTQRLDDDEGHDTGTHFSILNSQFECRTQADCISRCTVVPRPWTCGEAGSLGNPLYTHRTTSKPGQSQILGGGLGAASTCGFAIGCAVDDCFLGLCGAQPTITFGGLGAGIEATVLGTTVSDLSVESGVNCPPARAYVPLPPRCEELAASVVALPLRPAGETRVLPIREGVKLLRLEPSGVIHHGSPVSYLVGEYALVTAEKGGLRVRRETPTGFDEGAAREVALAAWGKQDSAESLGADHKMLLVAVPSHEANSRIIAIPELRLSADVRHATRERGKILVRADFGEDHRLQALELLHTDSGAGSWKVMLALERALSLEPSTERHRVVTFAWLDVGETIKIESSLAYLPRCCCGTVFCA
jgi:hypothetical protein